MIVFPNAKINIGLSVTGRRTDGYHNIESLMLPAPLYDVLEVVKSDASGIEFSFSGLPVSGDAELNLCVKAYRLMQSKFGIGGIKCHLHKVIPMGAGLGGGSADAAFMLKLLNELFALELDEELLAELALQLGSDCPFFIYNKPALVKGRGEQIEPLALSMKGTYLLLISPGIHVSTADAYKDVVPHPSGVQWREVAGRMKDWQQLLVNDFEKAVFEQHPLLLSLKQMLLQEGAFYSAMSGSGSTIYGLFHEKPRNIQWPPECESWLLQW